MVAKLQNVKVTFREHFVYVIFGLLKGRYNAVSCIQSCLH